MAKFNFFDMFKRKDKSDASNGSEKKQKTIEEMTFDELYSAYNDCKIKELMSDNMQIGNEDKQKIEARLEQITVRMISLIRQKDSQAVAFVNKLISRYSSNHETLKKLKSIKRDLQKVRDRISELEVKELLENEQKQRQEELLEKTYECDICFDDMISIDNLYIFDCGHKYCQQCCYDHIHSQIFNGNVFMKCCSDGCSHVITYQEVYQIIERRNR